MKKKLPKSIKTIAALFSLLWKVDSFYFIVRLMGKIIAPINAVALSLLFKEVINFLVHAEKGQIEGMVVYAIFYSLLRIIDIVLNSFVEYSSDMENEKIEKYIKNMIIVSGTQSDIEAFDNVEYYNKLLYLKSNYSSMIMVAWQIIDGFAAMISFCMIFSIMLRYDVVLTVLMVVACIPAGIMRKKYTKILYDFDLEQLNNFRRKDYFVEIATNKQFAQEIRLYNMSKTILKKYNSLWSNIFLKRKWILKKQTIITSIILCIPEIVFFGAILDIGNKIIKGTLSIGDFSLYISLLSQLWNNIMGMISAIALIWENKMKIEYIEDFAQVNRKMRDGSKCLQERIEKIEFVNVKFRYPYSTNYVLDGFNLKIVEGERIAIMGLNGTGKSTLIKLLLRFYDVNSGEIMINGRNIKQYKLDSLRKQFSLYFQDAINYCFTIRDNIVLGNTEYGNIEKRLNRAAFISGFSTVVRNLEKGYDTYISKLFDRRGAELSKGQLQKLALCRMVFREASVMLLDEPSSFLDPSAEQIFFKRLQKVSKDKILIFISHKVSNLAFADRIIVMEEGKVIGDGKENELFRSNKRFREFIGN